METALDVLNRLAHPKPEALRPRPLAPPKTARLRTPAAPAQKSPDQNIDAMIRRSASMTGVPYAIAKRLVRAESSFNPRAVSGVGAQGLTQLMPATAKELGVANPFDPAENLAGGLRYLASMKHRFGSWAHALAAYNWGPSNVESWLKSGGNPNALPSTTRAYIHEIAPQEAAALEKRPAAKPAQVAEAPQIQTEGPNLNAMVNSLPTPAGRFAGWLRNSGMPGPANALEGVVDAAQNPLGMVNDVLGAPQRFIAGGMAEDAKHHAGSMDLSLGDYGNPIEAALKELGGGVYGAFHPNDATVEQNAQAQVPGLNPALGAVSSFLKGVHVPVIPSVSGSGNVNDGPGMPANLLGDTARFVNKAAHGLGDVLQPSGTLAFQTATDPLTYLGAPLAHAGDTALGHLGELGDAILRGEHGPGLQETLAQGVVEPNDRVALTPEGVAQARMVRGRISAARSAQQHTDEALLKKYAPQIAEGKMPPEIETRLLRDAYIHGTPELRAETLDFGYKPTPEEAAKAPTGVLKHHLKDEYFPHLGQKKWPEFLKQAGREYRLQNPGAPFEKPQIDEEMPADPVAAMESRLRSGRNAIAYRLTRKQLAEELGIGHEGIGIPENPELAARMVRDPRAAKYVVEPPPSSSVQGLAPLQKVSNIGRDNLIGMNPIPHSKNIGMLTYLAGGREALAKGAHYAMRGIPEALAKRLEEGGAGGHFMLTDPDKYSLAKYLPWRGESAHVLDRVDTGMRAARLEQIDRDYPHLTEAQKMQRVNEDIGDYRNSPGFVQWLKGFGAQFPQWHGYIVPTAVGRAALRAPQRIEQIARAADVANQSLQGKGYRIEPGGPVSEAAEYGAALPQILSGQWAKALLSPSMIGPVGSLLAHAQAEPQDFTGKDIGEQVAQSALPAWSVISPLLGVNQYGSKAPAIVRAISSAFAAHPYSPISAREQAIRDLMAEGLSRYQATRAYLKYRPRR